MDVQLITIFSCIAGRPTTRRTSRLSYNTRTRPVDSGVRRHVFGGFVSKPVGICTGISIFNPLFAVLSQQHKRQPSSHHYCRTHHGSRNHEVPRHLCACDRTAAATARRVRAILFLCSGAVTTAVACPSISNSIIIINYCCDDDVKCGRDFKQKVRLSRILPLLL